LYKGTIKLKMCDCDSTAWGKRRSCCAGWEEKGLALMTVDNEREDEGHGEDSIAGRYQSRGEVEKLKEKLTRSSSAILMTA